MPLETLHVAIARPYEQVYEFVANPANLSSWLDPLGPSYRAVGPMEWVADRPEFSDRPVTLVFTPRNAFGVLDIRAYVEGQQVFWAPVRAIDMGDQTVITLGLVGNGKLSAAQIESEREWIRADLLTLKSLLEGR